jgi:hypothetical protein
VYVERERQRHMCAWLETQTQRHRERERERERVWRIQQLGFVPGLLFAILSGVGGEPQHSTDLPMIDFREAEHQAHAKHHL